MTSRTPRRFANKYYPVSVSVSMIVVALLLSFVDLMFLNDVIGKVLDVGVVESLVVACALGLVGAFIMAHQGVKVAHDDREGWIGTFGHYSLWLFLGASFVLIRIFSASILQLNSELSDENLIKIYEFTLREVDLVIAPLMLFLYLATGLLVKDGVKNLLKNPEWSDGVKAWKQRRKERREKDQQIQDEAAAKIIKQKNEAEAKRLAREKELEAKRIKEEKIKEQNRVQIALQGSYGNALKQYRAKEAEIKDKYQKISSNIDYIKEIDKQEDEFENKVKPSLFKIVNDAIYSAQSSIALMVRKRYDADIKELRSTIDSHNMNKNE